MFPFYGKYEKRFIADLECDIVNFINEHSSCNIDDIREYFGEPNEIIKTYLSNIDSDDLYRKISKSKHIKICISLCVCAFIITCTIAVSFLYQSYMEGKAAYIDREVTTIQEK